MNKNTKKIVQMAKLLKKNGLLHLEDNINLNAEANYQLIAKIVEDFNVIVNGEEYNSLKDDTERLISGLALHYFEEDELLSDGSVEFMEFIISEYIDYSNPTIIENYCVFTADFDKLQQLYNKGLAQIVDGKFRNFIFE